MNTPVVNWMRFDPPRRKGVALHLGALALASLVVVVLLILALSQQPGLSVVLLLIGALLFSLPLPLLFYRLYALWQSGYWIGREGLRLRWGLRLVDLPYEKILDVARAEELEGDLVLPRWSWPGGLVGQNQDAELGVVEFMAAEPQALVLIGTEERVFAISPEATQDFVATYKRESERGSLRPMLARSVAPSFVLVEAWGSLTNRRLLIAGAGLGLGLLVLVGILAPGLQAVSLGFAADGQPLAPVAGVQLFLLPALNLFFYMGNFVLGLLFYREAQGAHFSTLLWGSSLVTGLFFLGAILFSL